MSYTVHHPRTGAVIDNLTAAQRDAHVAAGWVDRDAAPEPETPDEPIYTETFGDDPVELDELD